MDSVGKFWKRFRGFLLLEIIIMGIQWGIKVVTFIVDPKSFIKVLKNSKVVIDEDED